MLACLGSDHKYKPINIKCGFIFMVVITIFKLWIWKPTYLLIDVISSLSMSYVNVNPKHTVETIAQISIIFGEFVGFKYNTPCTTSSYNLWTFNWASSFSPEV